MPFWPLISHCCCRPCSKTLAPGKTLLEPSLGSSKGSSDCTKLGTGGGEAGAGLDGRLATGGAGGAGGASGAGCRFAGLTAKASRPLRRRTAPECKQDRHTKPPDAVQAASTASCYHHLRAPGRNHARTGFNMRSKGFCEAFIHHPQNQIREKSFKIEPKVAVIQLDKAETPVLPSLLSRVPAHEHAKQAWHDTSGLEKCCFGRQET